MDVLSGQHTGREGRWSDTHCQASEASRVSEISPCLQTPAGFPLKGFGLIRRASEFSHHISSLPSTALAKVTSDFFIA